METSMPWDLLAREAKDSLSRLPRSACVAARTGSARCAQGLVEAIINLEDQKLTRSGAMESGELLAILTAMRSMFLVSQLIL